MKCNVWPRSRSCTNDLTTKRWISRFDSPAVRTWASQPGRSTKKFPAGSAIVLTGSMIRPRSEVKADLIDHGYVIGKAVTKKTAMVITADKKSQPGKVKRALGLGAAELEKLH